MKHFSSVEHSDSTIMPDLHLQNILDLHNCIHDLVYLHDQINDCLIEPIIDYDRVRELSLDMIDLCQTLKLVEKKLKRVRR